MRMHRTRRHPRSGFTLIEVLVVIVIIAILAALSVSAVWSGMKRAKDAAVRTEIGQFDVAINNFQQNYSVPYIPSRIWLDETGSYSVAPVMATALTPAQLGALADDSRQYLERVFGRNLTYPIDWNGDGTPGNANVVLEGHQTLVFFLGGIPEYVPGTSPRRYTARGFSTNPVNPANFTVGGKKGPFAELDSARLIAGDATLFPAYLDRFGQRPYAYFSSYKAQNGFARYGLITTYGAVTSAPNPVSDCESLGLRPYYEASGRYLKADSYQIISAGRDQKYGNLTAYLTITVAVPPAPQWPQPWSLDTATLIWPNGTAGNDDLCNFAEATLGSGN